MLDGDTTGWGLNIEGDAATFAFVRRPPPNHPLRYWRSQRELSAAKLAEIVGTNQQQITKLENGQRRMTEQWIRRLAKALAVDPSDLIDTGTDLDMRANELELLHVWRRLPHAKRADLLQMMRAIAPDVATEAYLPTIDVVSLRKPPHRASAAMHEEPARYRAPKRARR